MYRVFMWTRARLGQPWAPTCDVPRRSIHLIETAPRQPIRRSPPTRLHQMSSRLSMRPKPLIGYTSEPGLVMSWKRWLSVLRVTSRNVTRWK